MRPTPKAADGKAYDSAILPPSIVPENGGKSNENRKNINLTAYTVEYIDQREPKPRTIRTQTVVLDGGKVSALARLDMRPAGWITAQFERDGYTVASVHKGETITAHVDLFDLWQQTMTNIEHERLKIQLNAAIAQLNSEGVEV